MTLPKDYTPPWGALLDKQEACKVLECSMSHLELMVRMKQISPIKTGRHTRYPLKDIEIFIMNQMVGPKAVIETCKSFAPVFDNKKRKARSERV